MIIPQRRKAPRMGARVNVERAFSRHRKWVRGHECCVPACKALDTEFAHIRSAANSGTGKKPHDAFGVALCAAHHREFHAKGHETCARAYGVHLYALAAWFMLRSPDTAMRDSFYQLPDHVQRPLLEAA